MGAPPLEELSSSSDFEAAAQKVLPKAAWDYIAGGEGDTIATNARGFEAFGLRPRVLRNVESVDLGCSFLGESRRTPFYLSSVAKGGLVAGKQGETAFVRAVARAGTTFIVPMIASRPLAEIWGAAAAGQRLPYQYYLLQDEAESAEKLQEALAFDPSAIVVTVDSNAPRAGYFNSTTRAATGGLYPSPVLTWTRLAELRAQLPKHIPVYLKGIQTAEDALEAVRTGVHGIIVSNHGGRSCADAWSSMAALEDVAYALGAAGYLGKVELLLDSGVRSGLDALKALCLGATGVGLGRAYYWASACHGEDGVVALLDMLRVELQQAMAQVGVGSLADLGPHLLCRLEARPQPLGPLDFRDLRAKL